MIPLAQQVLANNTTLYGPICRTENNVVYRNYSDSCVAFGCEYGYYRVNGSLSGGFACEKRTD